MNFALNQLNNPLDLVHYAYGCEKTLPPIKHPEGIVRQT
jgi:hypothetical protein